MIIFGREKHSYNNLQQLVGFEFLMEGSIKMADSWVIAPCSLLEVYQHFTGTCCLWNISKPVPDYRAL
jgi:hypothetical protein